MQIEAAPGFVKRPDYQMDMIVSKKSYTLFFGDQLIAQSNRVIELDEGNYDTRFYFPKSDIKMAMLEETDHSTYCPFKGTARYWTIRSEAGDLENGVWAYDAPYQEGQKLQDHLCFYMEKPGFELRETHS